MRAGSSLQPKSVVQIALILREMYGIASMMNASLRNDRLKQQDSNLFPATR